MFKSILMGIVAHINMISMHRPNILPLACASRRRHCFLVAGVCTCSTPAFVAAISILSVKVLLNRSFVVESVIRMFAFEVYQFPQDRCRQVGIPCGWWGLFASPMQFFLLARRTAFKEY